MKETQQSRLSKTGPTLSWTRQVTHDEVAVSSLDEIQTRTAEIVLFFLDLERITRDKAYLEVATLEAKRVADEWQGVAASPIAIRNEIDPTLTNTLSRATFTLAEAWKTTENSVFRDAELHVTRCIAGIESAARRRLDVVHEGGE